jgi:prevent-host-death family protein
LDAPLRGRKLSVSRGSYNGRNRGARSPGKLSELLDRVENGDEVVITRQGRPIARLVPMRTAPGSEESRLAAERIRERASQFGGKFDWEEWKKYRDEGRK